VEGIVEFATPTPVEHLAVQDPKALDTRFRIHAEWNQLSVETGRLSCSKPALQCIPKDPEPIVEAEDGENAQGQVLSLTHSLSPVCLSFFSTVFPLLADTSCPKCAKCIRGFCWMHAFGCRLQSN